MNRIDTPLPHAAEAPPEFDGAPMLTSSCGATGGVASSMAASSMAGAYSRDAGMPPSERPRVYRPRLLQWNRAVGYDTFATSLAASIRPADLRSVPRTEAHGP